MFIQIEATPNPNTLKFLPGVIILPENDSKDFTRNSDFSNYPLVKELFDIEHQKIQRVFFGYDFISITKVGNIDWSILKPSILTHIMDFFSMGRSIFVENQDSDYDEYEDEHYDEKDIEIVTKIKDLIVSHIRPSVAQDGGDIKFTGYKDGEVFVKLQGACSGCPSAAVTLRQGVLNMLQYYIPEVTDVKETI